MPCKRNTATKTRAALLAALGNVFSQESKTERDNKPWEVLIMFAFSIWDLKSEKDVIHFYGLTTTHYNRVLPHLHEGPE